MVDITGHVNDLHFKGNNRFLLYCMLPLGLLKQSYGFGKDS
jgi:hypothetical protein